MQRLRNALHSLNAWLQLHFVAEAKRDVAADDASARLSRAGMQGADTTLDVRGIIAAGGEPLDEILRIAGETPAGGKFHVDAPFDPVPLRTMLGQMGFADDAVQLSPQHWRVTFEREKANGLSAAEGARMWHGQDGLHIDVGHLDPARQSAEIVALADACANVPRLTIHLGPPPAGIAPELAEKLAEQLGHHGWSVANGALPQDGQVILLTRDARA